MKPKRSVKDWSEAEIAELKAHYADTLTSDLARRFGCSDQVVYRKANQLKLRKSEKYLKSNVSGRFNSPPSDTRNCFAKGHIPWNKGVKGICLGGKQTQFKSGCKPSNHRPVGSTRVGQVIINSAKVEVAYLQAAGGTGTGFVPSLGMSPTPIGNLRNEGNPVTPIGAITRHRLTG